MESGQLSRELPTGKYRIALTRHQYEGQEVIFPRVFTIQAGRKERLYLRTAVEIALPAGFEVPWRWEVVKADKPDQVVQWNVGSRPVMLVPPGQYLVAVRPTTQDWNSQRLLWPQRLQVREDEHHILSLDSGIELAATESPWRWEVVKADKPDEVVQWQTGDHHRMTLPPGEYRIALRPTTQDWNSQRLVWPDRLEVKEGRQLEWKLDTGLRLIGPKGAKPLFDFRMIDEATKKEVQWARSAEDVQWVPTGTYTLEGRPTSFDAWQKLVGGVKVERGRISDVAVRKWPQKKEGGVGTRRK